MIGCRIHDALPLPEHGGVAHVIPLSRAVRLECRQRLVNK